jgi:hypothetical protein
LKKEKKYNFPLEKLEVLSPLVVEIWTVFGKCEKNDFLDVGDRAKIFGSTTSAACVDGSAQADVEGTERIWWL